MVLGGGQVIGSDVYPVQEFLLCAGTDMAVVLLVLGYVL